MYSCLFERFRFINYKTFSRMKVIINFCKEVINLVVSFNLWYYDVNNNEFKVLKFLDTKDVNWTKFKTMLWQKYLKHLT